jgi:hypothetical protein
LLKTKIDLGARQVASPCFQKSRDRKILTSQGSDQMLAGARNLTLISDFKKTYSNSNSNEIHRRAIQRAKNYRRSESELIDSLREVEDDQTFKMFHCTSLHHYALSQMGLSEDVACTLIVIMRKSRSVPELAEALRSGAITASKARKIVAVINETNKAAWLELASTSTSRVIEKAVATENPKLATIESIRRS